MGLLRRVLGGNRQPERHDAIDPDEAMRIIREFGHTLEVMAPAPGCVADAAKLPYQKDRIKAALVVGLLTAKEKLLKEALKVAYLQLADWQNGVGDEDAGIDFTKIDLSEDPLKSIDLILSQGTDSHKWEKLASTERDRLRQELVDLGLW